MVERRSPKPNVVGSSPSTPASNSTEHVSPPAQQTVPAGGPGSLESLGFGVFLACVACLPFLVAAYPQLTDYPSHLARYHVMLEGGNNGVLARYYDFDWILTGNLGADLLMWPLGKVLGVELAAKAIGAMIPVLTGLGIVAVEWAMRRRIGIGALLAFATIWSPAMGMGFYNFTLALALALFAFAVWVGLEGKGWRWAVSVPVGIAVWLCHVSGWGVLGVLVFGYEWNRRKNMSALLAPWPLFPPFALLLLSGASSGLAYGANAAGYKIGIWMKALRDQSMQLDLLSLAILALAIVVAMRSRRFDGRLGWAALILGILTLVIPRHLGGGDYADWRLIAVALMAGCMAIDWQVPRWAFYGAAALFLFRLGVTAAAWHGQSQDLEQALLGLDDVPRGARVAGAVAVPASQWGIEPLEHAPSYASVRRDALVNSHFAIPGVHMLQLKQGGKGFVDPSQRILVAGGDPVDLSAFGPARQADYLWYFGRTPPARLPAGAKVLHRSPVSTLARLAKPADAR